MIRHCLGYCYADLIRDSLSEFVSLWNQHPIRKSHATRSPSGVPNTLYTVPEMAGNILMMSLQILFPCLNLNHSDATDHLCSVDDSLVDYIIHNCCEDIPPFYPAEFKALCDALLYHTFAITHSDITTNNVKYVYAFLVDSISI